MRSYQVSVIKRPISGDLW